MRLVAVVLLGVSVTFALTAVGEEAAMSLRDKGTRLPYFEAIARRREQVDFTFWFTRDLHFPANM